MSRYKTTGPQFIPPLYDATVGDGYGDRGGRHFGVDFPAPEGTDVIAVASGQVVRASFNSSLGNTIIIDHGTGVMTLYAHLSSMDVSRGDHVEVGEKIGAVGNTGSASHGPHLHLAALEGLSRSAINAEGKLGFWPSHFSFNPLDNLAPEGPPITGIGSGFERPGSLLGLLAGPWVPAEAIGLQLNGLSREADARVAEAPSNLSARVIDERPHGSATSSESSGAGGYTDISDFYAGGNDTARNDSSGSASASATGGQESSSGSGATDNAGDASKDDGDATDNSTFPGGDATADSDVGFAGGTQSVDFSDNPAIVEVGGSEGGAGSGGASSDGGDSGGGAGSGGASSDGGSASGNDP